MTDDALTTPLTPAEAMLTPLLERLEQAADLLCRSDALQHFAQVTQLCSEAAHLAKAAAILTTDDQAVTPSSG